MYQDQEFSRIASKEIKQYGNTKDKRNIPAQEKRNKPHKKDYTEDRKRKRGD